MSTAAYPEKKHRLSRLLGKREKTPEPNAEHTGEPTTAPVTEPNHDSAYGSSEANSADGPQHNFIPENERHGGEMVPAEKNSEIANIDQARNLAVKPSTGEVFDEDTGEVVTVVTTTTTTTTTTTMRGGKKHEDVQKDVRSEVQSGSGPPPGLLEMPAGPRTPEPMTHHPAMITTSSTHQGRPPINGGDMLAAEQSQSQSRPQPQPRIPAKSPMRRSGDVSREVTRDSYLPDLAPISPVEPPFARHESNTPPASPSSRPNFSYPSRSNLKTVDQPTHNSHNTVNDLRAAAKGLHGVGETLRGTLNSNIDRRFPSKNAEKAARTNAYNDGVLERGRTEMEGIKAARANAYHDGAPERGRTETESIPGGWPGHETDYHADPTAAYDSTTLPHETIAPGTARDPSPTTEEKSKGLRKLFKRKPVG